MPIYSVSYPKVLRGRKYYRRGYVRASSAQKVRRFWKREFSNLPIREIRIVKRGKTTDTIYTA